MEPHLLIDRELSWLEFNSRVLDLAEDSEIPILERVRFLSIFSSNLDDFFMIRVASVKLKLEAGGTFTNTAGYSPQALLEAISEKVKKLVERQSKCLHSSLIPALQKNNIHFVHWSELTQVERDYVKEIFDAQIFPVLTPLAVDPSHPFPYISGLSLSLAVIVKHPSTGEEFFARVKVPNVLPRFIPTHKNLKNRFIALEEIIAAQLEELFPGMIIEDYYTFRLTRNEDLDLEEEDSENLLETMEQELLRRKFGPPVRLEVESDIKALLLERLITELEISPRDVIKYTGPLDLTGMNVIADLDHPELRYPLHRSQMPRELWDSEELQSDEYFDVIKGKEILLHHPYESFSSSVVRFIETAALDPQVLAIKQTLYRTSGDSPIMGALIEAAQAGKQVLAVVEIRARFDEMANVRWARKLEEVGVHVVYGLMGLKTHAKLSLAIREEGEVLRRYCHVGTGNYNPKTARFYDDLGILSSDPVLGEDLSRLFNELSGYSTKYEYSRLLVAPHSLRNGLIMRIKRETKNHLDGRPSWIRLKLNSLLDEEMVAAIYDAADAGVKVDVVVRGICSLQLNNQARRDNIRVRSILGRFLEHSRIFYFKNDGAEEYYIGSADMMHRNLDRRVEALVRLESEKHKEVLRGILDDSFSPKFSTWSLSDENVWIRSVKDDEGNYLSNFQDSYIERFNRA